MPAKNHCAARGSTHTNTATQIMAVNNIFPASAITAARRNAALSGPNFGVMTNAKKRAGMIAARLPKTDEYAATGPTNNKTPASNRAEID